MFTPVIDLEVANRATILRFSDITGSDLLTPSTKWDGASGVDSAFVSAAILSITDPNGLVTSLNVKASIAAAHPVLTNDVITFTDITGQWIDGYYTVLYNIWMSGTTIIAIDNYSSVVPGTIRVRSAAHGLSTGMKVTIAGTAGIYDGTYDVTKIDADYYYVSGTFSLTDTGLSTPLYSTTYTPFVFANVEMAVEKMYAIFAEMEEGSEADDYLKQVELCNGLLNTLQSALTTTTVATVNNIYGRMIRILDFNGINIIYS